MIIAFSRILISTFLFAYIAMHLMVFIVNGSAIWVRIAICAGTVAGLLFGWFIRGRVLHARTSLVVGAVCYGIAGLCYYLASRTQDEHEAMLILTLTPIPMAMGTQVLLMHRSIYSELSYITRKKGDQEEKDS